MQAVGSGVLLNIHDPLWLTDWTSSLGANLLGQARDSHRLDLRLNRVLMDGWVSTLPSSLESEAAEKLAFLLGDHVPGWSPDDVGVRWCGTGTDAVAMAVRLARAVTGREWVVCFRSGYHGWADWTVSRTEPASGVVQGDGKYAWMWHRVINSDWGDVDGLESMLRNLSTAAVVFEHPPWHPLKLWWGAVRNLCDEHGVLLVADEVVTGLRNAPGGACQLYGIEPDLVAMGKALGNGLPVAALVGRRDLMGKFAETEPIFCSSTSWGNAMSLAAADHVLGLWLERGEEFVAKLWRLGGKLMDGLLEAGWTVTGHPPRSVLDFRNLAERKFFIDGMMKRGHLFNRPNFPNLAMTEADVEDAVGVAWAVYEELDRAGLDAVCRMYSEDELPRVLFRGR